MRLKIFGMLTTVILAASCCQPVGALKADQRFVEGQDGFTFTDEYSRR